MLPEQPHVPLTRPDEDSSVFEAVHRQTRTPSLDEMGPTSLVRPSPMGGSCRIEFWYSRKQALLFIVSLFLLASVFGSLIPPFQSPDEFNHLKRAYLLPRGIVAVGSVGTRTGAGIDEGLLAYMVCFEPIAADYGAKVDQAAVRACDTLTYTGRRRFSDLSNTAMYFPLLYLPQAVALIFSEDTGLSVKDSYYLARLLSLCTTLTLLLWAMTIYPVPPAVLALFILPMSLFQMSSASLDAVSFATTALAASLFLRGYRRDLLFGHGLHTLLATCIFLLATSRFICIALTPMLVVLYGVRKSRSYAISFVAVLTLSLAWIIFARTTVHGQGAMTQATSSSDIIRYYLIHPVTFLGVVFRTLTDATILRGYWEMFVGVLGWMDIPLGSAAYVSFAVELMAVVIVSTPASSLRYLNRGHLTVAGAGIATLLLLFLVALSAWTEHPATVVRGIQGRYLYPIVILLLFACWTGRPCTKRLAASVTILIFMAVSSVDFTVPRLIHRYYAH